MSKPRKLLRRVHIWLAWITGVPLLLWTASGLWMVARPIEEVRGTGLRADPPVLPVLGQVVAPHARALRTLTLDVQAGKPVWIASFTGGGAGRADPQTGRWLPPVLEAEARGLAAASLRHPPAITLSLRTPADRPPLDLRRSRPAWGVRFADGTRVYVDADTGSTLAVRTAQWRAYDWMWGLHVMDLSGRENTSHAVLIASAVFALFATLAGLVLLPLARRRRR